MPEDKEAWDGMLSVHQPGIIIIITWDETQKI
jgi:hypothetical protein